MPIAIAGVTVDARNALAVATFWAEALGRSVVDGANDTNAVVAPDPNIPGSRILFRQVPEDKQVKNRMHFDLTTKDFDAEISRLIGLGATTLQEFDAGLRYVTLADPEGNEFDLVAG